MSGPLAAAAVAVTRPRDQAAGLIERLHEAGARVVSAPALRTEAEADAPAEAARLGPHADWLVFVSPSAVSHGCAALAAAGVVAGDRRRVAAVGPGTAHALTTAGWPVDAAPATGGGGEALLAEPDFRVHPGARALIVRGDGGRETLAAGLEARGARVDYLAAYRRVPEPLDGEALRAGWQSAAVPVTIVTSETGLMALYEGLTGAAHRALLGSRLVVVSERLAQRARALGFTAPRVAAGAGDDALIRAVEQVVATANKENP